jgi:hypothetical protein
MCNQLLVIAKWQYILNTYKWDKQNIMCLLCKPSDACTVWFESLPAQVMSHTVEASHISAASLGKENCTPFIVLKKEVKRHIQISPTSEEENVPF